MNRPILFLLILSSPFWTQSQERHSLYPDSLFSTYYHQRVTHFNTLEQRSDDIIFLGNSITDGGEWSELFHDIRIKNRGISGDISAGIINRLDGLLETAPAKIFLLIGINDLARNTSTDSLWHNYQRIIAMVKNRQAGTKLYIQSILPVSAYYQKFSGHTSKRDSIARINALLEKNQSLYGYTFINLHDAFCDETGRLNKTLTNDGLHLKGEGYLLWKHLVYPYVYDVQEKTAVLPVPKNMNWNAALYPYWKLKNALVNDSSLLQLDVARILGHALTINTKEKEIKGGQPVLKLLLGNADAPLLKEEAYHIQIDSLTATITANTLKGIFYGLQTFKQLARDQTFIDGCSITDWPSFEWRGYMTDAGRNYESVSLLKQQIEVMSRYKMNVFHFHPTEDIAWRWEIKKYPALTATENMLRNKGMYYTIAEIKDLIQYCKDRYIQFVPEIDMPGHSAAFMRAMGVDMQSEKGKAIVADILQEIFATYSFPYFHIGGDEVRIKDTAFIPLVDKIVRENHSEVIGWKPGGNFAHQTILQLWNGNEAIHAGFRYIDSRHLYINHFDPFESVMSIYSRKIGNTDQQNKEVMGAELCLWNDRNVANESDLLRMNPVYPDMLVFAEKLWNGKGEDGFVTNIHADHREAVSAFAAFEKKILEHQQLYFKEFPFAYTPQSGSEWKLAGPFDNQGKLESSFSPEQEIFNTLYTKAVKTVIGNTIVLRHFWDPIIKGVLDTPRVNSTWYALNKRWSDVEGLIPCWIGFNDFSRSTATDNPPAGYWDNRQSCIWVNGKLIAAPQWERAGQRSDLETPLSDQGYSYRKPMMVYMKKGWNEILVKLPVGSFKGTNWQNPVKWMFSFSTVQPE